MATQVHSLSPPHMANRQSSKGFFAQITAVFVQPAMFFRQMPRQHQWVWAVALILIIAGYAASNQAESTTTTNNSGQAQSFDISLFQQREISQVQTASSTTQTTSSNDTNTTLMSALLAGCGVLVMWAGQAILLGMVTMLRGYPPQLRRNLQIAVWASLPLALMLILRQVYFATGGTGGEVGLVLLLEQWDGYSALPELTQRVLAVFASNLSLFWLWNLALLYLGARYVLEGRRWSIMLALTMWIIISTAVPALMGDPVTTVAPRTTTETTTEVQSGTTDTSSTTTTMPQQFGGFSGSGNFPSGSPPSGGGPGGGGLPGG